MSGRYRKKPVVIEAIQYTGSNAGEIRDFVDFPLHGLASPNILWIETLEGTMRADKGDWIIKGVQGEFYPCKPDIFAATYEMVADQ